MQVTHTLSNNRKILDALDEAITKSVEDELARCSLNVQELRPIIKVAINHAKDLVRDDQLSMPIPMLIPTVSYPAYNYVMAVASQHQKFDKARDRIISYGSVFLVGAGLSFESEIPLTRVLNDLLPFCGVKDYEELRKNSEACCDFKTQFKRVCDEKSPGDSHDLIALNFPRYIKEIICLNWDNLIERSAIKLSRTISKVNEDFEVNSISFLWKFHGDIENIKKKAKKGEGEWVFPDEEGFVFKNFEKYIKNNELTSTMFAFVILGYSEGEKEIYMKIIKQFEEKRPRPTFRVGLDLERLGHENYLVGPSSFVLKKILPIKKVQVTQSS